MGALVGARAGEGLGGVGARMAGAWVGPHVPEMHWHSVAPARNNEREQPEDVKAELAIDVIERGMLTETKPLQELNA